MTTSPTTASALPPLPPARGKTFTIEAERRLEEMPEAAGAVHRAGLRPPRSAIENQGPTVPAAEYGVIMVTPGHRLQVVVAHQAEQVLAEAAPAERRPRMSRPG